MKTALYSALFLVALGFLLPEVSTAAPCQDGVDCYCDKVKNTSSPLYDPAILICEDFESHGLYQNVPVGTSAPSYGPWYDATGQAGNRGVNSYWNKNYGNGVSSFGFRSGEPANPALGSPCSFSLCTGSKVWERNNLWSANAYNPQIAFFTQPSDFNFELGSLTAPTNKAGGGSGVFDGNANLVHRIGPGVTHGIAGEKAFGVTRTIGYTGAIAYPINSDSSGIWGGNGGPNASWKHNEWATVYTPNGGWDGLFIFYNQNGPRNGRPFAGFFGSFQDRACKSGSIVATLGTASCTADQTALVWNTPANYSQPTDWPWGTWGCVRGFMENAGLSNQRMRVWFQGPNMTSERLIIDITVDGTTLDSKNGYNGLKWNAYANTNQGTGYVASTALTFRYEDNVHVRAGTPVSCSQIGFVGGSGSGDTTPPTPPANLRLN